MKEKINIDERYHEHDEISVNHKKNQQPYYKSIRETFNNDWDSIGSFIDVGCREGYLMDEIYTNNKDKIVAGIDYFTWGKKLWDDDYWIHDHYNQWDMRDTLNGTEWFNFVKQNKLFDIVNCTEVAEHIDPDYCNIFMENLKMLTNKYLIISWSPDDIHNGASDPYHQHVNALQRDDFYNKMDEFDFMINAELTDKLVECCNKHNSPSWYVKNHISIWENYTGI